MVRKDKGNFQTFSTLKDNKLAGSPMATQRSASHHNHRKILAMISLGHVKSEREKNIRKLIVELHQCSISPI